MYPITGSSSKLVNGARSACLIILAVIFFVSPASAAEKTESVDVKESTIFQGEHKVVVQNLRKKQDTQTEHIPFEKVTSISPSATEPPFTNSKLYILYHAFKLLD